MLDHKLSLDAGRVLRGLVLGEIVLLLGNAAAQFSSFVLGHNYIHGIVPLFNFGDEANFQTFYSLLLLLSAGVLLIGIARLEKQRDCCRREWMVLACGFFLMAFDEAFSFHEKLVTPMQAIFGTENLGVLYFTWVVPGGVLSVFLAAYFAMFLRSLPSITARRFIIAACLYLGGALGFELLGGRHAELHGRSDWGYSMYSTTEEALEMAGIIVFIWALLEYYRQNFDVITLRFSNR